MILNRTDQFLQMRGTIPASMFIPFLVDDVRIELNGMVNDINELEGLLQKISLPAFNQRMKRANQLRELREKISQRIALIQKKLVEIKLNNPTVTNIIKAYFTTILNRNIIMYKEYESRNITIDEPTQENLKIDKHVDQLDEYLENEARQKNSLIQKRILNLGNTISQLKLLLNSQTSVIDTIDIYFTESNIQLEKANEEIRKIPGNYIRFKNMIIYTLLYIICFLLIIILIKTYKERKLLKIAKNIAQIKVK